MATITFLLKDLKDNGFDLQTLEDLVPKIGMEIETSNDKEIIIDITPNRPDMLDFTGFLRAIKLFSNLGNTKKYEIKNKPFVDLYVDQTTENVRPFINAVIIKNINLNGSRLKYLINFIEKFVDTFGRKRKKFAVGLYNFDKIKPNLFYGTSKNEKFIPLNHKQEINFNEILIKNEKGIKYKNLIYKDKDKEPIYLFLKDSEKILSLIPIINSEESKITESTKNLLIDITGISEIAINNALNIIICSFMDNNAEIYPIKIHYKNKVIISPNLEYKQIKVKLDEINKNIGIAINTKTVLMLLKKMDYTTKLEGNSFLVDIPPYRIDVFDQQDIIEDIAIAYGYNNIKPKPIIGEFESNSNPLKDYSEKLSLFMIGLNFLEVMNFYLTNETLNFEKMQQKYNNKKIIKISYSKTEAITMLRTSLIPYLLSNLESSANQIMPLKIFEIGRVFSLDKIGVKEDLNLSFISEHSKANFAEIKADIEALIKLMNYKNYEIIEEKNNSFIDGRCAAIYINNNKFGIFGEIHPQVLKNFNINEPVIACELIIKDNIKYDYKI